MLKNLSHTKVGLLVAVVAATVPGQAMAQATTDGVVTEYVSQEKVADAPEIPQGFDASLTLGGNLNLAHNRYMVGQVDGTSVLFGLSALANMRYRKEKHEWRGNLSLAETWARTPVVDEFVKSNDVLDIENLYNYHLLEWTGPFARLAMQTAILPTERVTADPQTYVEDGDPTNTSTSDHFKLAKSFQPFTINESVGWFAQPVSKPVFTLYGRAGLGGRHTFANGAKLVTDDKDPAAIKFVELDDVHQGGVELFAGFDGKAQEDRLQYSAAVSALFPMLNNDDLNRSTGELTRVAAQGMLGVGIFKWMSLNYLLKVIRDPQLIDEIQVQNSLLLTVSLSVSTEEPAPPPVDPAIAALEQRAKDAEARAAAAEARAVEAEKALAEPRAPTNEPTPAPAAPVAPAPEAAPQPAPQP